VSNAAVISRKTANRTSPQAQADAAFVPLVRSLGYHIRELSESLMTAMNLAALPHGITLVQWRYLRELWESDGLSAGELTRRVGRQGPTTVVAVQSLERAGFVRVEKDETDRRRTYAYLTARGRQMAEKMSPAIQQINDMAAAGMTADELKVLKRLIVRIQRNVDAHTRHRTSWSLWRTDVLAKDAGVSQDEQ